ncbi:MAG: autotransporter-associated beta strand repeat-containing protein [Pirellulales bacterium]|nr:autotransporter-associated beta strand repeat-containing protein [Pirellulales bacterium]
MGFLNFSFRRGLVCAAAIFAAMLIGLSPLSMTNDALAGNLTWTGADPISPEYWDYASANWTGDNTVFSDGDNVTFDDTGSNAYDIQLLGDPVFGLSPGSVTVDNSTGHDYLFAGSGLQGSLQGTTGITKNGTGMLRINTRNSFSGVVTVNAGMLRIGTSASEEGSPLGSADGGTTVNSGATMDVNGKNLVFNNDCDMITIAGTGPGAGSDAGAIINTSTGEGIIKYLTLAADATIGATGNTISVKGTLDNHGNFNANGYNLTKVGSKRLSFEYLDYQNVGNIDIQEGSINISRTSFGDPTKTITVRSGAMLRSWNNPDIGAAVTISSNIISEGGILQQEGSSSAHVYTGNVQLNGDADTQFNVIASSSTPITTTFSGNITGTQGMIKYGWRTLYLEGANDYAGNTTINLGTVALQGTATLASPTIAMTRDIDENLSNNCKLDVTGLATGQFTLASGQKIMGDGSVVGNLVSGAGSILEPGLIDERPVGELYIMDGDLTLQDGALLNFDLDDPADPTTSDRIILGIYNGTAPGNLILNSQDFTDFSFTPLTNFGVGVYTLIDAGSISGSLGANVSGTIDGLLGTLSISDTDLILTVTSDAPVVPGDTDNDGDVDQNDAATLAGNWGTQVTNGRFDGDFNDDTWVNAADAAILAANWTGPLGNESAPVPEPSILAMMACLSAIFFLRRRNG